jgi:hypothetical protein
MGNCTSASLLRHFGLGLGSAVCVRCVVFYQQSEGVPLVMS